MLRQTLQEAWESATDWLDTDYVNGYWFLYHHEDWQPSATLQQFLATGDPPLYIGFGSMAGRHPQRLAKIAIKALQTTNQRGFWPQAGEDYKPNSYRTRFFNWIRPLMIGYFLRCLPLSIMAGRELQRRGYGPDVQPLFGDQPFWGERVHTLGVGPRPIPQKRLTVKKLVQAIQDVTLNVHLRHRAEVLGQQIRAEDGIGNAIAIIETLTAPQ